MTVPLHVVTSSSGLQSKRCLGIRTYLEWKPKLVEPCGEARAEWDIFRALSRAARIPFLNNPIVSGLDHILNAFGSGLTSERFAQFLLLGKTTLRRLMNANGGIKFGDIQWGEFVANGLYTDDQKIHLAPEDLVSALGSALDAPPLPTLFPAFWVLG